MSQTATLQAIWDLARAESAKSSQRWILSAMRRHGPALVTLLWRILGNEQDVCDAYQDVFLQLAHRRDGTKPDNIKAYVFRTATNTAVSMLRRRWTHDKVCLQIANQAGGVHRVDYAGDLDSKDLQQRLRYQISRLPDHLRAVVLLHDLAGLPYDEVAKTLDITRASARIYRHRAVKLLAIRMTVRRKDR